MEAVICFHLLSNDNIIEQVFHLNYVRISIGILHNNDIEVICQSCSIFDAKRLNKCV